MAWQTEKLRTPHKVNRLVLSPSYTPGTFDSHAIDCPAPFRHDGKSYITYVGFDGMGYRTGLALSDDLLTWHKEGLILDRGPAGSLTQFNAAMTCVIRDNELFGSAEAKLFDGRFVNVLHAYPTAGYEEGPAVTAMAFSDDLRRWEITDPVLRPQDGESWECGGLYKSWIVEHEGTFYMFYNAKNRPEWPWIEQIGLARSTDLLHWTRYEGNPILTIGPKGSFDDLFASDPCVFRYQDTWVMFYFGNSTDGHARDSVAFSKDLLHWEKSKEILVDVGPEGSIDSRYAHKPGIIAQDGKLYHFYCAVAPSPTDRFGEIKCSESRGISVAIR